MNRHLPRCVQRRLLVLCCTDGSDWNVPILVLGSVVWIKQTQSHAKAVGVSQCGTYGLLWNDT